VSFFRSLLNRYGKKKGNPFYGKQIFGVLAGAVETKDTKDLKIMNRMVKEEGYMKWFEGLDFGPGCDSTSQVHSCAAADGTDAGPGSGNATTTTTPAALPRRIKQAAAPMRRAQVQVRPRLAPKFAGVKLSSLI
jgi:hypothetical protein